MASVVSNPPRLSQNMVVLTQTVHKKFVLRHSFPLAAPVCTMLLSVSSGFPADGKPFSDFYASRASAAGLKHDLFYPICLRKLILGR